MCQYYTLSGIYSTKNSTLVPEKVYFNNAIAFYTRYGIIQSGSECGSRLGFNVIGEVGEAAYS